MQESRIAQAISERGVAAGAMLFEFDTPGVMRILAAAGVDFAIFDLEHTAWDAGTLRTLFAAGRDTGVHTITRVIRAQYPLIASALDAGSRGVMAPMLESRAEAELLVESAKYPPLGHRGFGVLFSDVLADGPQAYTERANRDTIVIAQIESPAGIENADAIVGVPGVDIVWLGQFDLTLALGIPGQFDHPAFTESVDHLLAVCRRHRKPLGQLIASPAEGQALRQRGFQVLAYADVWVFERALRDGLDALRGA
jgi:2-keto-3-deoxy-L-rhamnonate aldolase RhmA